MVRSSIQRLKGPGRIPAFSSGAGRFVRARRRFLDWEPLRGLPSGEGSVRALHILSQELVDLDVRLPRHRLSPVQIGDGAIEIVVDSGLRQAQGVALSIELLRSLGPRIRVPV